MGLLDDLKKQAEMVKTQQLSQDSLRDDAIKLVEDKMKQTFHYLNDLLKQLAVIKPTNPMVYSVPGVGDLSSLQFFESFIDFRRKRINDKDHFDVVTFYLKWSSGENLVVERDMPVTAQKVRDLLYSYNLKFTEEETKNERGMVAKTKFTVQPAIVTDVTIKADHEQGRLLITAKNLLRLGRDDFVVPAGEINDAMLEEFAKSLIGQASGFRKFRSVSGPPR
ncbi:MAG: hypothetical protein HY661_22865 [Betaproteobacteria bacterium]|nr:hypothetical protein [Betaproteobacteria bacterium]